MMKPLRHLIAPLAFTFFFACQDDDNATLTPTPDDKQDTTAAQIYHEHLTEHSGSIEFSNVAANKDLYVYASLYEAPVMPDGTFTIPIPDSTINLIRVMDSNEEFVGLKIYNSLDSQTKNLKVDAASTAEALLFLSEYFISLDYKKFQEFQTLISSVLQYSNLVEYLKNSASSDPEFYLNFENPDLQREMSFAIESIFKKLGANGRYQRTQETIYHPVISTPSAFPNGFSVTHTSQDGEDFYFQFGTAIQRYVDVYIGYEYEDPAKNTEPQLVGTLEPSESASFGQYGHWPKDGPYLVSMKGLEKVNIELWGASLWSTVSEEDMEKYVRASEKTYYKLVFPRLAAYSVGYSVKKLKPDISDFIKCTITKPITSWQDLGDDTKEVNGAVNDILYDCTIKDPKFVLNFIAENFLSGTNASEKIKSWDGFFKFLKGANKLLKVWNNAYLAASIALPEAEKQYTITINKEEIDYKTELYNPEGDFEVYASYPDAKIIHNAGGTFGTIVQEAYPLLWIQSSSSVYNPNIPDEYRQGTVHGFLFGITIYDDTNDLGKYINSSFPVVLADKDNPFPVGQAVLGGGISKTDMVTEEIIYNHDIRGTGGSVSFYGVKDGKLLGEFNVTAETTGREHGKSGSPVEEFIGLPVSFSGKFEIPCSDCE